MQKKEMLTYTAAKLFSWTEDSFRNSSVGILWNSPQQMLIIICTNRNYYVTLPPSLPPKPIHETVRFLVLKENL